MADPQDGAIVQHARARESDHGERLMAPALDRGQRQEGRHQLCPRRRAYNMGRGAD